MRIDIVCFSDAGAALAKRLRSSFNASDIFIHATEKLSRQYGFEAHKSLGACMEKLFPVADALIFIGAAGIAVRAIAPFVTSKTTDPAVVVMDDQAQFAISLLSGHIGGANALAGEIAAATGAQAVITTATDVSGRFACDSGATAHGCTISSMSLAKKVSAAILAGEIPLASEYPLPAALPNGLIAAREGTIGIYIGVRTQEPFAATLRLIPRIVTLGIGCRRGTPPEAILEAITTTLAAQQIDMRAICAIASIDVKKDEAGLLAAAAQLQVPTRFYSAEELLAVPGTFEESAFVREQVGVGNVCERAALCSGGSLVIPKTAAGGVTVAAAVKEWSIVF